MQGFTYPLLIQLDNSSSHAIQTVSVTVVQDNVLRHDLTFRDSFPTVVCLRKLTAPLKYEESFPLTFPSKILHCSYKGHFYHVKHYAIVEVIMQSGSKNKIILTIPVRIVLDMSIRGPLVVVPVKVPWPQDMVLVCEPVVAASLFSSRSAPIVTLPSSSMAPWEDGVDVTACRLCDRAFSFLVRKHHCRRCGKVVCGTCAPAMEVRLCGICRKEVTSKLTV